MAKTRKKAAEPEVPLQPSVGDKVKVKPDRSVLTYGGKEVDLHVPGTNMQRFRERVDNLTFVERNLQPEPQTLSPIPSP
jgi:hypothetical protein